MELDGVKKVNLKDGYFFFQEQDMTPWAEIHPCAAGVHRWAWLVDGSIACGYCETRLY